MRKHAHTQIPLQLIMVKKIEKPIMDSVREMGQTKSTGSRSLGSGQTLNEAENMPLHKYPPR